MPGRAARRALSRLRARRARVWVPLAAAAAVTALVASLVITSPFGSGANRAGSGANRAGTGATVYSAPPAGAPRFYVDATGVGPLRVYDTATGKVIATIQPPPGTTFSGEVAATAGEHTFVTAAAPNTGPCVARLYEFRLSQRGQPGPLAPLGITVNGNFTEYNDLSITPDGRMIGYAIALPGCYHVAGATGELGVINLVTRQIKTWTFSQPIANTNSMALSAAGRRLAFTQWVAVAGHTPSTSPQLIWQQPEERILPTSATPGRADQHSAVVARPASWGALNRDGSELYVCRQVAGTSAARGSVTFAAVSLTTGRSQVIASWPDQLQPECAASLDSSGRYLLIQLLNDQRDNGPPRLVIVDLRTGRLTNLRPAAFTPSVYPTTDVSIAW